MEIESTQNAIPLFCNQFLQLRAFLKRQGVRHRFEHQVAASTAKIFRKTTQDLILNYLWIYPCRALLCHSITILVSKACRDNLTEVFGFSTMKNFSIPITDDIIFLSAETRTNHKRVVGFIHHGFNNFIQETTPTST